jgi:hypothetical protein
VIFQQLFTILKVSFFINTVVDSQNCFPVHNFIAARWHPISESPDLSLFVHAFWFVGYYYANFSEQDKTWAEFSTLNVAAFMKQNGLA